MATVLNFYSSVRRLAVITFSISQIHIIISSIGIPESDKSIEIVTEAVPFIGIFWFIVNILQSMEYNKLSIPDNTPFCPLP